MADDKQQDQTPDVEPKPAAEVKGYNYDTGEFVL